MLFNYLKTETYMDSIDIDDTGNCILQVFNDDGREWILSIETKLGWSKIKTFGPFTIDSNQMDNNFYYSVNEFEYKEKKIYHIIDEFINNPKKQITQIFIIDEDTFNDKLSSIKL